MGATSSFLNYITSKWGRDIPLKNLWTIKFDNLPQITQSVGNILRNTEVSNSSHSNNRWPVVNFGDSQDPEYGLFLAQGVVLPTDSFATMNSSNTNMNGLRAGYIGGERSPYSAITVEFLETNTDIIDHFFRPWTIAAAHKGLIEDNDPQTNIKTNIRVELYSRVNTDLNRTLRKATSWQFRKAYVIEGVVPTNIEGDKLKYSDFTASDLFKSVSFIYKNYWVESSPNLLKSIGRELPTTKQVTGVGNSLANSLTINSNFKSNNAPQSIPTRVWVPGS